MENEVINKGADAYAYRKVVQPLIEYGDTPEIINRLTNIQDDKLKEVAYHFKQGAKWQKYKEDVALKDSNKTGGVVINFKKGEKVEVIVIRSPSILRAIKFGLQAKYFKDEDILSVTLE